MDDYLPSPMLPIKEKIPCPIQINSEQCTAITDKDLISLMELRSRLTKTTTSSASSKPSIYVSLQNRLDQWYSYFCSLSNISPHYDRTLDRLKLYSFRFVWQGYFKPSKKLSHSSITSEKMTVAFNVAAVYSQMAATEDLSTVEGLSKGFKGYQNAVGVLRYVKEKFDAVELIESVDVISREFVCVMEKLMVAQAQECFFLRTVLDGKAAINCSRAARQVGLYYEQIRCELSVPPLNQQLKRDWFAHVQLKASQFFAECCYHFSVHLHTNNEIGEEIARLRVGIDRLKSTKKATRGASSSLVNFISRLDKKMKLRLEKAEKENNSIYYMRVPAASSLSDLPAYALDWPNVPEKLVALDSKSTG